MSKTTIPAKVQYLLWAVSGGRCEYEGCNKILYMDILTKTKYNISYKAHIIGDEPGGPRGDSVRSELLAKDIKNLMLLCDEHHRLIDKEEVESHPEERLLEMKRIHEERIRRVTGISSDKSSQIILYGANIGNNHCPLSYEIACNAMSYDYYPENDSVISLAFNNSPFTEETDYYWKIEEDNLIQQFNSKVKTHIQQGAISHYSIFAMAPQPLLIRLGTLLNDINEVRIYQKHREPSTWKWQDVSCDNAFNVIEPEDKEGTPVLIFSLSANITYDRVERVLGKKVSIWELRLNAPNNDCMKSEKKLSEFRSLVRSLLNEIKLHKGCQQLHVFPAMPISTAIEFGRVWMPKADMPLVIYDEIKDNGFVKALTI